MPTNLYGLGGNFHPENSHALPALMHRLDEAVRSNAQEVVIWGFGNLIKLDDGICQTYE